MGLRRAWRASVCSQSWGRVSSGLSSGAEATFCSDNLGRPGLHVPDTARSLPRCWFVGNCSPLLDRGKPALLPFLRICSPKSQVHKSIVRMGRGQRSAGPVSFTVQRGRPRPEREKALLKATERVRGGAGIRHEPPPPHTPVWEASLRILAAWAGRKPRGSWESCTYIRLEDKW